MCRGKLFGCSENFSVFWLISILESNLRMTTTGPIFELNLLALRLVKSMRAVKSLIIS